MTPTVLYLVPDLFGPPGGIARYCRMVYKALANAGISVEVLALNDADASSRVSKGDNSGVRYQGCGGSRTLFVRRALQSVISRPHIILVGHPYFTHLGWLLACLTKARLVSFMYGIDVWQPLTPARRWSLRRADQLISISNFTAERAIQANNLRFDRIRLLPNCLDPELMPRQFEVLNNHPLSLLTVARTTLTDSYKGHDYVIKALRLLLPHFPELVYDVVGDGNWRPTLEALAGTEGVKHAVRFHGFISEADLITRYEQSSVFVMPSRCEGFGFVFLEAMAHGTPVIGGNQDATPEVIVDGKTGLLVDPTCVEEIAAAIARLLSDSELRRQMGQAGVARARDRFGFPTFQRQLLSYLAELGLSPNSAQRSQR